MQVHPSRPRSRRSAVPAPEPRIYIRGFARQCVVTSEPTSRGLGVPAPSLRIQNYTLFSYRFLAVFHKQLRRNGLGITHIQGGSKRAYCDKPPIRRSGQFRGNGASRGSRDRTHRPSRRHDWPLPITPPGKGVQRMDISGSGWHCLTIWLARSCVPFSLFSAV
jgi:hypothetical protein